MNDRITALEQALAGALSAWDEHNERGHAMQGDWVYDARTALAASRAATDCHQPDLVTADRVRVLANALRNGSQADMDGVMVTVSRQACEEAADILAALDLTPAPADEPRTVIAQDAARVPEIAAMIDAVNRLGLRALVAGWNGEGRDRPYTPHKSELGATIKTTCGTVYAIDAALRAIGGDE